MLGPLLLSLCLLLSSGQVVQGFHWNSLSTIPDDVSIPGCVGQDVSLPWHYSLDSSEHLVDVQWHFTQRGQSSPTLIATKALETFSRSPTAHRPVDYINNGGIRISNVTYEDSGTYSVHVNYIYYAWFSSSKVSTVTLVVTNKPLTTDGALQARMASQPVYDTSRGEYVIRLECGHFDSLWATKTTVSWKTPAHGILHSTGYDNYGYFYLHLPNPVHSGDYTCFLDSGSNPVSECLPNSSPLRSGTTIRVDAIEAKIALMEAELRSLKAKLQKAVQQVYFYAVPSTAKSDDHTALFDHVVHNVGSGYSSDTGYFTAPVSGLYLFMVTADSARSNLHVKVTLHVSNGEYVSALGMGNASGSNQLVVHLYAGEYAFVSLDHAPLETQNDSSFVGVLIQADI